MWGMMHEALWPKLSAISSQLKPYPKGEGGLTADR